MLLLEGVQLGAVFLQEQSNLTAVALGSRTSQNGACAVSGYKIGLHLGVVDPEVHRRGGEGSALRKKYCKIMM